MTVKEIAYNTIGCNHFNSNILDLIPAELAARAVEKGKAAEISKEIDALRQATTEKLMNLLGESCEDFLTNLMYDSNMAKSSPQNVQKIVDEMRFLALLSQTILLQ
jgi:hypothetical protein